MRQLVTLAATALLVTGCAHHTPTPAPAEAPPAALPAQSVLVVDEVGVAERAGPDGTPRMIPFVRRGPGDGYPTLLVVGGPFPIEWFGRWMEPAYNVVYPMTGPSIGLFVEQVADLDAVRQTLKLDRMAVWGHSQDGALAFEYAAAFPQHTDRVVWVNGLNDVQGGVRLGLQLLAERAGTQEEAARWTSLASAETFDLLDFALAFQARQFEHTCEPAEPCRRLIARAGAAVKASGYMTRMMELAPGGPGGPPELRSALQPDVRGQSLLAYDSGAAAEQVGNVPFLMLVGAEDGRTPPETSRALHSKLPQAQLVEIADCGHNPFIERPAETIEQMRRFLDIDLALPPVPSTLPDDWKPAYDNGEKSADEIEAESAARLTGDWAGMAMGLLMATCETLGAEPPAEQLAEYGLAGEKYETFYALHCQPPEPPDGSESPGAP